MRRALWKAALSGKWVSHNSPRQISFGREPFSSAMTVNFCLFYDTLVSRAKQEANKTVVWTEII